MTEDYRNLLREKIAEGVHSRQKGNVMDGGAFMAQMDAGLHALERQGLE